MLLSAAVLKAHRLATEPVFGNAAPDSRLVVFAGIWFEALLGCWMLAGLHRRVTRWLVIVSFSMFAAVALSLAVGGAESCGCFGRVHVNPWYTATLDAAIATGVWLFPGSQSPSPTIRTAFGRFVGAAVSALSIAGALTVVVGGSGPPLLGDGGPAPDHGSRIVLRPETWVGKRFPLLRHIDFGLASTDLSKGTWLVVLFRPACTHCQEVIPKVAAWAEGGSSVRVAFVEVPPYGSPPASLFNRVNAVQSRSIFARLSTEHEWFVQTPVLIELSDGTVHRVPTASQWFGEVRFSERPGSEGRRALSL